MCSVLELVLNGQIAPNLLIDWLDGLPVKGVLEELSSQRVEFVPVFLNFLRDQSSSILQNGVASGLTPSKCASSIRVVKYVSPGKDPAAKARARKEYSSTRAKTLRFSDNPDKLAKQAEGTCVPDVDLLLRETESSLTVCSPSSLHPPKGVCTSTPKSNHDKSGISRRHSPINPKSSPEYLGYEKHPRGKRHNLDPDDRGSRGIFGGDRRYSEQRLSLGDFIQSDTRKGSKKKSPLPRDNNAKINLNNNNNMVRQLPKALDLSDENAFPMVGSTPPQDKQSKRRINPTRITPVSGSRSNKTSPFNSASKNAFGFPQGSSPASSFNAVSEEGSKTLEEEREMLRLERLRLQEVASKESVSKTGNERESPPSQSVQKPLGKLSEYKEASLDEVTKKSSLDVLAHLYSELILCNMVPSVMVELYYVIQLLTIRVLDTCTENESVEGEIRSEDFYLDNLHNCVYFAIRVLSMLLELVKLLDRTTITLLSDNSRIQMFSEDFQRELVSFLQKPPSLPPLSQQPKSPIRGVSFQSETDNRHNFSCDQAFHVFRKQRDAFYEIIRVWEENHITPGWSYSQALGPRIRHLLSMKVDPTNFAHFARLFQSQLLTMCRGEDVHFNPNQDPEDLGFLTLLKKQHPEKYKRLHERLVTPSKLGGPCPAPSFPGSQEFFKEFIVTASNGTFNQFLKDVLISHILQLNEQDFIVIEQSERDPMESMVHMEARSVLLNLRLLAKFLGFVEFLPYQTVYHLSENVIATQVDLRSKVCPPINLNAALRQCASSGRLIVGVTWIVEYLSMVDPIALHSKHYLTIVMTLIAVFKILYIASIEKDIGCKHCSRVVNPKNLSPSNCMLLKLLLGWLFDLSNFPDGLFFADISEADIDHDEYHQNLKLLRSNYSYLCALCLRHELLPNGCKKEIEVKELELTTPSKSKLLKSKGMPRTPIKQTSQEEALSPLKTPSKYLAVSMLETPDTTPLKAFDQQDELESIVCLDTSHFVDHQLITICCPFVCELKNLLSDFLLGVGSSKNTGSNSCRRITPLSASEKDTSGKTQAHLQLQLEENFFHNHSSSVRKTIDFVVERISSNIMKKMKMTTVPQFRETAVEKLKAFIESQVQSSSSLSEYKKEALRKQVSELSQEMFVQLKSHCSLAPNQEIQEQVSSVLRFLLPSDFASKEVEICQKLVVRSSMEKVSAWAQAHLTPSQFLKDLTLDSDRLLRQAQKAADSLTTSGHVSQDDASLSILDSSDASVFTGETSFNACQSFSEFPFSPTSQPNLPRPVPKKSSIIESLPVTAKEHDCNVVPPSQMLKLLKGMVHKLISSSSETLSEADVSERVVDLLHTVKQVITRRQDVTLTVFRALEALTVDFSIAIACCTPSVMTSQIQNLFVDMWKPVEEDGLIPSPCGLHSYLCPQTVMLIAQNPSQVHQEESWKKLEEFICLLLSSQLLSPVILQEQCVSLLRHSWPEEVLRCLSSCIQGISKKTQKYKNHSADDSTFAELLEWVGWVCGEMEEFPDVL